jgi:YidC/Oxa1 family membrane protein insertase
MSAVSFVVDLTHAALDGLTTVLTPLVPGLAAALAVVVLTAAVRLFLSPLTYLRVRAERRRKALAPRLSELRDEHRDDPVALATESMALYRANGVGPLVTLLPGLLAAPFFMLMYRVTQSLPGVALGVPLTAHLAAAPLFFAALLAAGAILAWWSSRQMRRATGESGDVTGMQRWLPLLPYLSLPAIAWLPLAGAIYLVTSTAWTVLERGIWR